MAIDLISVPTATMELADIAGTVLPGDARTTDRLSALLANNVPFTVTDYAELTDTDDQPMFQRAHDAAAAKGGGRIFVPNRATPYSFASTLNVTSPNVTFEGARLHGDVSARCDVESRLRHSCRNDELPHRE
jgi:hypothetical protein